MPSQRQSSFATGEVSKKFYGRTSDPRYLAALRTCKNFLPIEHGAMVNRPGAQLVYGDGLDEFTFAGQARLVPFIFSDQSTAVLVFTNTLVSFIVSGRVVETAPNSGTPYTQATPYAAADLARLKFAQSGDVITITHPSYAPQDLSRLGLRNWTVAASSLGPPAGFIAQTLAFAANGFGGDIATAYVHAHAYATGDYVNDGFATFIAIAPSSGKDPSAGGAVSNTQYWALAVDSVHMVLEQDFVVTVKYRNAFGTLLEGFQSATLSGNMVSGSDRPVRWGWAAPANPGFPFKIENYGIYGGRNGLFGWLDDVDGGTTSYKWDGHAPNFEIQPPKGTNPFKIADGNNTANTISYPGVVSYHEQRRVYFRTNAKPNHFIASKIGDFANFDVNSVQALDSDSYDWAVSSQQLEEIRSAVSQDQLVMLTGQSVFTAEGAPGQAISPTGVRVRRNGKHGASYLQPLEAEETIIFNTAKGNHVRDLTFSFQVGRLTGTDLTKIARHLFEGFTLVDWCYCDEPYPIIWAVRSDGLLLSCTYDREAQVVAWAQHPMGLGTIESVCCVPEGTEDAVYLLRNYGAGVKRVERMASRFITDQRFAVFLDCAISIDGRNPSGLTSKVFGGTTYAASDQVNFLVPPGADLTLHVGDRLVLDPDGVAGGPYPVTIQTLTSGTTGLGTLEVPLPPALQNVLTASWAMAYVTQTGLGHLIGQSVMVLADGGVQGPFVVDGSGSIGPISPPAAVVQVGIGYNSDAELMDLALDQIRGNVKTVRKAIWEVVDTRGLYAGEDFDHLSPAKFRNVVDGFGIDQPKTQQAPVNIASSWNTGGRAVLRQSDPLPITVVAAIREVVIGGD